MSDPFHDNPDLVACAQLVERADPERFRAAMAAPVAARAVLFPVYAFNVEVSRAPWASKEPLIVQMRLQWWSDVLDEIAAGGFVRRHEVVTPLAVATRPEALDPLRRVIAARAVDVDRAPFADEAALLAYLDATAGALAEGAARSLGATSVPKAMTTWGRAAGLARYLQAVPELEARGRQPLPDGRPPTLARLASDSLAALDRAGGLRALRRALGPQAAASVLEFWQARALLRMVARDPGCVAEGRLRLSEFGARLRLLALS
ncbi:squalene/phytoene synthase family protein [Thetidibacter halocola]|uniref:Squalene/phytoene synthase family protein n=1 Tax=Thetidibacter halocola TaxID=2827239 RepID=A0A8J7WAG7_9RHOB|nr:squalene/phytoene synthase family protein [Thetidibacter halocola]MBS0123935.1 squalene/phytoene synthase family protein [Thetidibacter halocola]